MTRFPHLCVHRRRVQWTWTQLCVSPANDGGFGPLALYAMNDNGAAR